MTADPTTPLSELVYLFVDGETSAAQEETLFNTLAGNPELQQELQEAILIRSTLEKDCSALAVPPETTAALFQKAGFALPGAAGVSTVATFAGKVFYGLKSLALPALFALGGAALSAVYFWGNMPSPTNTTVDSHARNAAVSVMREEVQSGALLSQAPLQRENLNEPNVLVNKMMREHAETIHAHNNVSNLRGERDAASLFTAQEYHNGVEVVDNSTFPQIQVAPMKDAQGEREIPQLSSQFQPSFIPSVTTLAPATETTLPITVSMRGLMELSSFPSVASTAISNEFNNIALSVGYDVSKDIRLGLEGGRQAMRYFTFENGKNEKSTLHTSIDWAGAFYRQQFSDLTYYGITPYTQVTLGGSMSGPSGRLLAGLCWQPDRRIALSAGIEGSTFLYQNSAEWYSLRSLGCLYSVEVKF
ncbi:MAG: hypothetical protein IPM69_12270 [Ignavibacteria bacterium]|nr:hypothetical protein [Ignavibacteria bacterium]